jgi:hypothetical protein
VNMRSKSGSRRAFYFVFTEEEDKLRAALPAAAACTGRLVWQAVQRLSNERRSAEVQASIALIGTLASVRYRTARERLRDLRQIGAIDILPPSRSGGECVYRVKWGLQQGAGDGKPEKGSEGKAVEVEHSPTGASVDGGGDGETESDEQEGDCGDERKLERDSWVERLNQTGKFGTRVTADILFQGLREGEVEKCPAWKIPANRDQVLSEVCKIAQGVEGNIRGACQWIGKNVRSVLERIAREQGLQIDAGTGRAGRPDAFALLGLPSGCSPGVRLSSKPYVPLPPAPYVPLSADSL